MIKYDSRSYIFLFSLLALAARSSQVSAAEIVLRERASLSGPVVRLGDIAQISAAASDVRDDLSTTPLLAAPAPGTREFLTRAQLRDLLKSRGVELQSLTILGARIVEIREDPMQAVQTINEGGSQSTRAPAEKAKQMAVVVVRDIAQGDLIRLSDVELRPYEGRPSAKVLTELGQAIGMESRRPFSRESFLQQHHLRKPMQVLRGETVTVFARTGGISVKTFATAKQDGAQGDLIQVQSLDKKQRYTAHVSGRRELEVLATGKNVREVATLGRRSAGRR